MDRVLYCPGHLQPDGPAGLAGLVVVSATVLRVVGKIRRRTVGRGGMHRLNAHVER